MNLIQSIQVRMAEGEGVLDTANRIGTGTQTTLRIVGVVVAMLVMFVVAMRGKGAFASILSGGITALVIIWFLNTIISPNDITDKIDQEIAPPQGAPAVPGVHQGPVAGSDDSV